MQIKLDDNIDDSHRLSSSIIPAMRFTAMWAVLCDSKTKEERKEVLTKLNDLSIEVSTNNE